MAEPSAPGRGLWQEATKSAEQLVSVPPARPPAIARDFISFLLHLETKHIFLNRTLRVKALDVHFISSFHIVEMLKFGSAATPLQTASDFTCSNTLRVSQDCQYPKLKRLADFAKSQRQKLPLLRTQRVRSKTLAYPMNAATGFSHFLSFF